MQMLLVHYSNSRLLLRRGVESLVVGREAGIQFPLGNGHVEVDVHYAGVIFRVYLTLCVLDRSFADEICQAKSNYSGPATVVQSIFECIAHQMNLKGRNEIEKAQFQRISIDSILVIEIVGQFRRNSGVDVSLASLAAANMGEFTRLARLRVTELCV